MSKINFKGMFLAIDIIKEKELLEKEILKNKVVSFDIFDTLVLREVLNPTDIFRIVHIKYEQIYKTPLEFDFYSERIRFENIARLNHKDQEDITLDDIYIEMQKEYDKEICNKLKSLELQTEEEFIVINPFMKEIFDFAKNNNKEIFIISDMYLSAKFIEKILNKLGFSGYKKCYVSSEYKKTKAFRSLYKFVLNEQKIDPKYWIHIGDNKISDVKNAKICGLNAFYYEKILDRANDIQKKDYIVSYSILTAIIINKIYTKNLDYWSEFGIKYCSKLYFGISFWLYNELKSKKQKSIHFLARDGYIIKHFLIIY